MGITESPLAASGDFCSKLDLCAGSADGLAAWGAVSAWQTTHAEDQRGPIHHVAEHFGQRGVTVVAKERL
ncbi:MAG: hypothetical protein IPO15_25885 [Anaerolineae bacterium]|uniref:hypothetical protein n=1 Tax=Candidatus Amarolinea dominans TaxID=3140696 RepID=UPI003136CAFD|nr:hypothetical protein [Anaerolineae bacterium]